MTQENRPYQPHPARSLMWHIGRQDDLTIGSLCSGYGGLEMGLQAVIGGRVAWHVEYDKHPSAVLAARFPGVPNYGDITTTDWSQVEPVDWLTAGYPCQPFSHAGKRKGSADERHLWPFVAGAVGVLRPRRVLLENVRGHVSLGLADVLADLSSLGYDATWGVVRAADAGAPHGRARLFIVAADARRERHGGRQDGRSLGRVDGQDASEARQRERSRPEPVDRGAEVAPDADVSTRPRDGVSERPDSESATEHRGQAESRRCRRAAADTDCTGRGGVTELNSGAPSRLDSEHRGHSDGRDDGVSWGPYAGAIRCWERATGRRAPAPTEPGSRGQQRLNARFVEWMMGLPDGWVTDVLPRNPALKALGNGVVPQQAALAVRTLLSLEGQVAA